jgi:hypothetical protein
MQTAIQTESSLTNDALRHFGEHLSPSLKRDRGIAKLTKNRLPPPLLELVCVGRSPVVAEEPGELTPVLVSAELVGANPI